MHQAKFCLVNQPYYYYRTRDFSLSYQKTTDYLAESCKITQAFIDRNFFPLPIRTASCSVKKPGYLPKKAGILSANR